MSRPVHRFWFRLARQLGMSMAGCQGCVTSREFSEWMVYDQIEPGEPTRGDYQAALVASVTANMHKIKGPPIKLTDFLLKFAPPVARVQPKGVIIQQFKHLKGAMRQMADKEARRKAGA